VGIAYSLHLFKNESIRAKNLKKWELKKTTRGGSPPWNLKTKISPLALYFSRLENPTNQPKLL
jgi:hypothetical protein